MQSTHSLVKIQNENQFKMVLHRNKKSGCLPWYVFVSTLPQKCVDSIIGMLCNDMIWYMIEIETIDVRKKWTQPIIDWPHKKIVVAIFFRPWRHAL